jgi:Domain of unknown function (DUF4355)
MSEGAPEPAGSAQGQPGTDPGSVEDPESPEGQQGDEQNPDDLAEQLAHWRTQARKHERRARENAAAATELAELKKSQMTELEKAQAEAEAARRERDEARADHIRMMAAATHDLPVGLIDYLGGGTEEEINERAEAIAGEIETSIQARVTEILSRAGFTLTESGEVQPVSGGGRNGPPGRRPVESMRPGSAPANGGEPNSLDEWFRGVVTHRE